MYPKSIFIFLIFGLLNLTKIYGVIPDATYSRINHDFKESFTGECNDIYVYLKDQGKLGSLNDCKVNDQGEVTELRIYPYCFENEQLKTVLSYNTIETLEFSKIVPTFDSGFLEVDYIEELFGCSTIPSNYESLSTLTNLKYLDLTGVWNLDINVFTNIPKSVKILKIGRYKHEKYFKLTQEIVDVISSLTNLNSLSLLETEFNKKLNFRKFENLKKFTSLDITYDWNNEANKLISASMFKYSKYIKNLYIYNGEFNADNTDAMGYMTKLEELIFDFCIFNSDVDFYSFKNLKNLTSLHISCEYNNYINYISTNFFNLINLKKLTFDRCQAEFYPPSKNSLTRANLKNLEYLKITNVGIINTDLEFLGDLPNVKEFYLYGNSYSSISEIIGKLKTVEVIEIKERYLDSLPKSIGNLENLRVLRIPSCKFASLPEEFGNLKNLEELVINHSNLTSLPESFGNLTNLRIFDGENNGIVNLPKSIGNLSKLESLNLDINKIAELPESIENLSKLEYLSLSNNNIVEIPKSIGNLTKLEYLDLSLNNIVELPNFIGKLNITTLYLYCNEIESIPDEIGNMKNLVELDLAKNKITNIPSSLGNLEKLEELYLSNNLIDDFLPESLNNLTNLRKISVSDNIDIKGKALSSPNLIICDYSSGVKDHSYSLCKTTNSTCIADYLPLCEEE